MLKRPTYEEYDEYIYDYDTTNSSFIAMASILKRKGIKNYNFFLKLYDEDLVGVDPYDEHLTQEYKLKIILECRRNFWYFIREIMRIPAPGGFMKFKLHRGNLAAAWAISNNIPTYLILPRQHGKTWLVIAFALWTFNFATDNTNMLFMNKQLGDSQLNLKRLKDARELLPDYLKMTKTLTDKGELKDGRSNVNRVENALHNEITVKASARNPVSADELGRGMTVAWVWIDEVAFVQFNRIIYAAMAPAWSKAAEIAVSKGRPTGKILTTTPSDLATDMGSFAYEIREDAAWFNEKLYDEDDISVWMEKNSKNGYLYIEFNYMQLDHKNPDKWFKEQCKELLYDWAKIRREILLQWNNASTNSPFSEDDLRDLRSMSVDASDIDSIIINKYYRLNVYRKLNPGDKYIVSVDPAKGRGTKADRTVVCVTDAKTDKVHAIFKSSVIQYKETFRFLYTLIYKYIPNSVLVVENNIDTLVEYIKNSTMKHLLYYEVSNNPTKETRKKGVIKKKDTASIVYGITTTSQNRPKYFDILFEYVRKKKEEMACRELVEEIETLEYKSPTRIEATSGHHDDVVLAYLIGQYVKMYGTNRARFGILYADDLGTEYKPIKNDVFRSERMNNRTPVEQEIYNNPFFNELISGYETMESMEKRWKSNLIASTNNKEAMLDYNTNVFSSAKDGLGLHEISNNAFYDLNAIDKSDNIFGPGNEQNLDFMSDIEDVKWF